MPLQDTGLLYRATGSKAVHLGVALDDEQRLVQLCKGLTPEDLQGSGQVYPPGLGQVRSMHQVKVYAPVSGLVRFMHHVQVYAPGSEGLTQVLHV